jgi:DNA-binding MarR family transcriptional regulator
MTDEVCLYDMIKETFLLLDFGDRRFLEQFDLTVPRYYALSHIANTPGLSPSLLSRYMFCDKSNITRLINGLEQDALVERRPHEQDGRVQRLYLTAAGQARYKAVSLAHREFVMERMATLGQPEIDNVLGQLSRLNQILTQRLDKPETFLLN